MINLNRLTRAIRDAVIMLAVGALSLTGVIWSITLLVERHPFVLVVLFIIFLFSVLVKICYDYEVDK